MLSLELGTLNENIILIHIVKLLLTILHTVEQEFISEIIKKFLILQSL